MMLWLHNVTIVASHHTHYMVLMMLWLYCLKLHLVIFMMLWLYCFQSHHMIFMMLWSYCLKSHLMIFMMLWLYCLKSHRMIFVMLWLYCHTSYDICTEWTVHSFGSWVGLHEHTPRWFYWQTTASVSVLNV